MVTTEEGRRIFSGSNSQEDISPISRLYGAKDKEEKITPFRRVLRRVKTFEKSLVSVYAQK
jgi:hypothetical protein